MPIREVCSPVNAMKPAKPGDRGSERSVAQNQAHRCLWAIRSRRRAHGSRTRSTSSESGRWYSDDQAHGQMNKGSRASVDVPIFSSSMGASLLPTRRNAGVPPRDAVPPYDVVRGLFS
jgi:hypothetical protein